MSETRYHTIADQGAAVDESREAAPAAAALSTQPPTPSDTGAPPPPTASDINSAPAGVPGQDDNNQQDQPQAEPVASETEGDGGVRQGVKLCRHVKEDGIFCHCPALGGRQYCYRHLRLRGQQMRMARAIAQCQPYQLVLPPLEDMSAVQAALAHVTAALTAGLLERRRAGLLLYALQQAASNLRFLARAQTEAAANASTTGAPPFSLVSGERVGEQPQRAVEEYPEFEAEFGLPSGLDLTIPPQVAFPPPEKTDTWAGLTTPQARPRVYWTKEDIELEELEQRRSSLSEESYNQQSRKVHDKIHNKVVVQMRHEREAEWEAEAARRNAKEEEKAQRWRSMDTAQQRAFMEGVRTGREEEAAERRQEEARAKKPAAKVGGEEAIIGMRDGQTARD